MPGSYKKSWMVRSYPEAVLKVLRAMPRVYQDGSADGVFGWTGRTYSHQRRDVKQKPPRLTVESEDKLVFQHDMLTPFTYTIKVQETEDGFTAIRMEVRTSSMAKDTSPAESVVAICYALTKALEPLED